MSGVDLRAACHAAVENSPLALAMTEGNAHVIRCVSGPFCELSEAAAEHLLGRSCADAVPGSRQAGAPALLDQVRRSGRPSRVTEAEHRTASGEMAYWTWSAWAVLDGADGVVCLVIEIRDDTAHVVARRAHERLADELRDANERLLVAGVREQELADQASRRATELNALLESVAEGVVVLDAEGRIQLINPVARELLGAKVNGTETWVANDFESALRRPDGTRVPADEAPCARLRHGESVAEEEYILHLPDAPPLHIVLTGSSIRDDSGRVIRTLLLFRDVTERRELEELKEQFLALVSHDLATPLAAIIGYAELLSGREVPLEPERRTQMASAIVRSAEHMRAMLDELRASTRLESGALEIEKRPVDLHELVREMIDTIGGDAGSRVQVHADRDLPQVPADPKPLGRAVTNLLTNALKFSAPGSPVVVRIVREEDEAIVSVTDRGPGIAPGDVRHLFQRFFRAETRVGGEGLGLGLYITRLIVEAHGGRIWAESRPGEGSTFSFAVPLADDSGRGGASHPESSDAAG